MHALTLAPLLTLATLVLACGSSGTGSTDTGASETAAPATTGDTDTGHASHASHTADSATESAGPTTTAGTHDHETDTHDHATHDTHEPTEGATTGESTPSDAYCECMLVNCHDEYHATWGEDHEASETMCRAAADAVPSVGMPAMTGNSIECRTHFCTIGHDDPAACASALGGAPCE